MADDRLAVIAVESQALAGSMYSCAVCCSIYTMMQPAILVIEFQKGYYGAYDLNNKAAVSSETGVCPTQWSTTHSNSHGYTQGYSTLRSSATRYGTSGNLYVLARHPFASTVLYARMFSVSHNGGPGGPNGGSRATWQRLVFICRTCFGQRGAP